MLSGLIVLSLLALLAVAALAGTVRDLLTDGYRRLPSLRTPVRAERPRSPRPPGAPRRVPSAAPARAAGTR
ncbi:MAG TPA: hypothetical protein VIL55_15405 [Naasia sp.]|jgi:hypothetical protein